MNHFVKEDFAYYERSIQAFYRKIFMKKIMWSGILICLSILLASFDQSFVLLAVILTAGLLWYIYIQVQKMNDFSNVILQEQRKWETLFAKENYSDEIDQILESEKKYYIELKYNQQTIDINKKDSRNLPSRKSGYTLLIGENANKFDLENEFVTAYYDIGSLKHAEIYKEQILKSTDFIAKKKRRMLVRLILLLIVLVVAGVIVKRMLDANSIRRVYEGILKPIL